MSDSYLKCEVWQSFAIGSRSNVSFFLPLFTQQEIDLFSCSLVAALISIARGNYVEQHTFVVWSSIASSYQSIWVFLLNLQDLSDMHTLICDFVLSSRNRSKTRGRECQLRCIFYFNFSRIVTHNLLERTAWNVSILITID